MTTLSVSLPGPMRQFVQAKVKDGSYGTTSEYIRSLIRSEQQKQARIEALRQDVQIGIDQADAGQFSKRTIDQIKANARKRLAAARKA